MRLLKRHDFGHDYFYVLSSLKAGEFRFSKSNSPLCYLASLNAAWGRENIFSIRQRNASPLGHDLNSDSYRRNRRLGVIGDAKHYLHEAIRQRIIRLTCNVLVVKFLLGLEKARRGCGKWRFTVAHRLIARFLKVSLVFGVQCRSGTAPRVLMLLGLREIGVIARDLIRRRLNNGCGDTAGGTQGCRRLATFGRRHTHWLARSNDTRLDSHERLNQTSSHCKCHDNCRRKGDGQHGHRNYRPNNSIRRSVRRNSHNSPVFTSVARKATIGGCR